MESNEASDADLVSCPALILASQSPRRRRLLRHVGYQFTVETPSFQEVTRAQTARQVIVENATSKAWHVADLHEREHVVVLAADTVVVLDNEPLGKPYDADDARAMLRRLSGRDHDVATAFAVVDCATRRHIVDVVTAQVSFRELKDDEIDKYVESREPLDKAGAYGIQDRGALLVEGIVGDYYTVVGLPLARTSQALQDFGITPTW